MSERFEYAVMYRSPGMPDPTRWYFFEKFSYGIDLAEARLAEVIEADRAEGASNEWTLAHRPILDWQPIESGVECLAWCATWSGTACTCGRDLVTLSGYTQTAREGR